MGRKEEDVGNLDRSEGAPPPASAFANGTAEALGASRMDQEEDADWDSDDEEQQELAAAAAKGKVCAVVVSALCLNPLLRLDCVMPSQQPRWLAVPTCTRAGIAGTVWSSVKTTHLHLPPVACCCLCVLCCLMHSCLPLRPMARPPRLVVCWAALCPSWP